MVSPRAKLAFGSLVTAAALLMAAAVWLWLHNVIIVAAPVAFLAVGCGWAGIDNALIYPKERAQRLAAQQAAGDVIDHAPPAPPPQDPSGVTVPH